MRLQGNRTRARTACLVVLLGLTAPLVVAQGSETPIPLRAEGLLAQAAQLRSSAIEEDELAALLLLEEAAALTKAGHPGLHARSRLEKARVLLQRDELEAAANALAQGLETARSTQDLRLRLSLLDLSAEVAEGRGRRDDALLLATEAAATREERGRSEEAVHAWLRVAGIAGAAEPQAAATALDTARRLAERLGRRELSAQVAALSAEHALASGRPQDAVPTLRTLLAETRDYGTRGTWHELLGRALRAAGDLDGARQHLSEAAETGRVLSRRELEARARSELAELDLLQDRPQDAATAALSALSLHRQLDDPVAQARDHFRLARALAQLGRREPARAAADEALALLPPAARTERFELLAARAAWRYEDGDALGAVDDYEAAIAAGHQQLALAPGAADDDALVLKHQELTSTYQLVLADAGLWARLLEQAGPGARGGVSLIDLRTFTREQDVVLVLPIPLPEDLVLLGLLPTGPVVGRVVDLPPTMPVEQLVGELLQETGARPAQERLQFAHEVFVAPLLELLPADVGLALPGSGPLAGLPWEDLLDPEGRPLWQRHACSRVRIPAPRRPMPPSPLLVAVDLLDRQDPGQAFHTLHHAAVRAREAELAQDPANPPATNATIASSSRRQQPGRRWVGDDAVFLGGASDLDRQLEALLPETDVLYLLAGCDTVAELEIPLPGPIVVLPSCHGSELEAARTQLFEQGARSVLTLGRELPRDQLAVLLAITLEHVRPGTEIGPALVELRRALATELPDLAGAWILTGSRR
ncbi:MAG: hypothetical protein AAF533_15555 [Acidobacteriota bacterium]